ncbi:MAG TPA: PP2C family protein-serine/threonine phosphatase, partial [Acidobacteriaceae bacterium]|nr:PP2C family protein-serine/threonine phosphatase [Acidobacteriaceae bacterium]
ASLINGPIDLSSTWLEKSGDDPSYASPHLDDSQWPVVTSEHRSKLFKLNGPQVVWYRSHVHVPPGSHDLALLTRWFPGTWTIYVNGIAVGSSGPPPPTGDIQSVDESVNRRFEIPSAALGNGDLTIAIRESNLTVADRFANSRATLLLGPSSVLEEYTALFFFRTLTPSVANFALELLILLIALALALTLRDEHEYLALALFFGLVLVSGGLAIWQGGANTGVLGVLGKLSLRIGGLIALSEFVRLVLGMSRGRLFKIYEWILASGACAVALLPALNHLHGPKLLSDSIILFLVFVTAVGVISFGLGGTALPFVSLWFGWKRRNRDAMLLAIPLLIQPLEILTTAVTRLTSLHRGVSAVRQPPIQGMYIAWSDAAELLLNLAMLLFLILRTVRIARSRAAMATDLHAVQSVQEILLARASHTTPGFLIEHVYYPASEVGGDFFLVSPGSDGSITAIVGDVSGKGLVAAMRVSMILGVLRREEQREPEAILRNLNEALMMQGDMGFTTACCVRLHRDGRYTIANAGHINPYIGGEEIATSPSLPLGMAPEQAYEQVSGVLPEGKTMVLMSDGVVEARSTKGELYGFGRLPALTMMSAGDIADVARRFGQEDDITVLTVACAA